MLGYNIKKYRKNKKLSQKQLAQETEVSTSYIQQLELGQKSNPSLKILIKISRVLGVDVKDLDPTVTLWEEFDEKIDTNKLKEELKVYEFLSQISTEDLIEELNRRDDFPIKIDLKH